MGIYRVFTEVTVRDKENKKNSSIKFNVVKPTIHGPRIKLSLQDKSDSMGFSSFPVIRDRNRSDAENDNDFDTVLDKSNINKSLKDYSYYEAGFAVYGRKEILDLAEALEYDKEYNKELEIANKKLAEFGRKIGYYKDTSAIRRVANSEREKRLKGMQNKRGIAPLLSFSEKCHPPH